MRRVTSNVCRILRCIPTGFVDAIAQCLKIQDNAQCRINAAHLVEAEVPDALAEPARVDRRCLLGKHSVILPPISTSGRKLAARADVDVGATSQVDNGS